MSQPVTDEELKLRKRARRRLVGAVALVLLAVLVLPWFVDNRPPPPLRDVDIVIPPVEPVDGKFPRSLSPDVVGTPLPPVDQPAESSRSQSTPPARLDEPSSQSAHVPEPSVAQGSVSPSGSGSRKDESSTLAPHESSHGSKEASPARARPGAATGGYVVQLGAYSSKSNATHLLARVKAAGFPGYTEPVKTSQGIQTRVRGGPYPTPEAAETARRKLRDLELGIGGKVVEYGK
ncbi:MAG: hypothetical protein GC151_05190 [Betaproteobacteria bacterium]|nr:hypothetical protein [Betaproteobacteria bacterium]